MRCLCQASIHHDAVIHFAAFSLVSLWLIRSSILIILYNWHGFSLGSHAECGIHVFSSTAASYGIPEEVPILQTTPQRPINPYGEQAYDGGHYALGRRKLMALSL